MRWLSLALVLACSKPASPLERAMERADVPGISVAIVRGGALVKSEVAGLADARTREPVKPETPFEVASIGKPIIAIAVMQLVQAKKLSLDEDINAFVPLVVRNPRFREEPITLRMLLSHTSSLRDRVSELRARTTAPEVIPDLEELLRAYLDERAYSDARPGDRALYSNIGFTLAALAVERAAGVRFAEYARAHVLEPAGATRAGYRRPGAAPHAGKKPLAPAWHAVYPVVDLRASAADIARVVAALMRGELLGEAATEEMIGDHLGWQAITLNGTDYIGHEGEDDGASTMLVVDWKRRDATVLLTNGDAFASNDAARARALEELLAALVRE